MNLSDAASAPKVKGCLASLLKWGAIGVALYLLGLGAYGCIYTAHNCMILWAGSTKWLLKVSPDSTRNLIALLHFGSEITNLGALAVGITCVAAAIWERKTGRAMGTRVLVGGIVAILLVLFWAIITLVGNPTAI